MSVCRTGQTDHPSHVGGRDGRPNSAPRYGHYLAEDRPMEHSGPPYVANARMYSVTDAASSTWRTLASWLVTQTGIELTMIEHPPPALLSELWRRSDLGCVFMCGWPIARAAQKVRILAAPVPRPSRYQNRLVYFTDIVVARNSRFETIEDPFGGTVGWTLENSYSGFNAFRHYLLKFRTPERPLLYRRSVCGLISPLTVFLGQPVLCSQE